MNRFVRYIGIIKGLIGVLFLLFAIGANAQFYNGSQMEFGKNRVQFNDFFWTYFRFEDYDVYFYLNGKELAEYTARYAAEQIPVIERKMESALETKVQFIVFNSLSDLKQSNIGLITDDNYNIGGMTHIVGHKVFLYFDGDLNGFERQIRAGIARLVLDQSLYGGSLGNQVKNSTLLTMPEWYVNGLVSYMAQDWDTQIENRVRDGILSGRYNKFNHLYGDDATWAGHSIWHYIAEKYGPAIFSNIVYMSKVSRNVESGFLYVLGVSFKTLVDDWRNYYLERFQLEDPDRVLPATKPLTKLRENRYYSQPKLDPNGRYLAYVSNRLGVARVKLLDRSSGKTKSLFRRGYRMDEKIDYSYPLLAWHPSGRVLAAIVEEKGLISLYFHTVGQRKMIKQSLFGLQKVLDFSYSDDGQMLVLSGVQKGQSDLFVFHIASGAFEQLTKDPYNDLEPRFVDGSSRIIFSSNRVSDTLRFEKKLKASDASDQHDLFLYNYESKNPVLLRVTHTPASDERHAMQWEPGYYSYLSDENGIYNRFIARTDSAITHVDTIAHYRYFTESSPVSNYSRNILEQDVRPEIGAVAEVLYEDHRSKLFVNEWLPADELEEVELKNTFYADKRQKQYQELAVSDNSLLVRKRKKRSRFYNVMEAGGVSPEVNIDDYQFDRQAFISLGDTSRQKSSVRTDMPEDRVATESSKSLKDPFSNAKQRNYNVEYFIDNMVTQVDFGFLNASYQPFTGGQSPIFLNPGLNGLIKVGVTDLLEDYRIVGGLNLSVDLENNEYLVSFQNLKRRLDKELILHRQALESSAQGDLIKYLSHSAYYILKWPLSPVLAVKGTASYRNERIIFKGIDDVRLAKENQDLNSGSVKGELVYDNTRNLGLNLYQGMRFKVFGEYYQYLSGEQSNLIVLGADFRHYTRIHRTFIWANRFAAGTSFGQNRLIFYMGGVDSWLTPKFDQDVQIDRTQSWAYQTLATNMRGFKQNIRNGNNFVAINSELRFPVFRYLANRPLRSDLLNNFQVVAFGDLGTAWPGLNPYDSDNPLFTRIVRNGPLNIKLNLQKEPIVGGLGFGVRTRLLGYFLRGDLAWGVEDGVVLPSRFYLSLGLDF